jgi:ribosomal protein S18 acetylase RimI-like enzyme
MRVTIRAATPDDARRIAEIHVAGWRAAYRGAMPDAFLDALSVDERAASRRRWLETPPTPDHRTWVAEDAGGIVAFAITGPSRDEGAPRGTAELFALYADPPRWGTGAGRALTEHLLRDLAARGASAVTLWVLDANARARRFYELAGFEPDGAEKHATFGGADVREMRYRLRVHGES